MFVYIYMYIYIYICVYICIYIHIYNVLIVSYNGTGSIGDILRIEFGCAPNIDVNEINETDVLSTCSRAIGTIGFMLLTCRHAYNFTPRRIR